jgi:hypothetical protein
LQRVLIIADDEFKFNSECIFSKGKYNTTDFVESSPPSALDEHANQTIDNTEKEEDIWNA